MLMSETFPLCDSRLHTSFGVLCCVWCDHAQSGGIGTKRLESSICRPTFMMPGGSSTVKHCSVKIILTCMQHIGTGGYGSVYRGIWKGLEVAIKTVVFQDRDEDGTAERVFKEAAIACNMSHEHIVNSFTNDLKRMPSQLQNELVDYKLYIIQVWPAVC